MLEAYWSLKGKPFDKSIKSEQLFVSQNVKELISRLEYMKLNRGIMLISGISGTGKTTALRYFTDSLSELSFNVFYVPLATVNVMDFYRQLAFKLSGEYRHYKSQLFHLIQKSIIDMALQQKKTPVIIFDEAHFLKNENFMELQMLSNFQMDSADPAIIILAGQEHLMDRLMRPNLRAFWGRITLKYQLKPLLKDEINLFIEHLLKIKGCNKSPFSQSAVSAIFKNTNGIPRLVNSLCHHAMTLGMIENVQLLTEEHIFQASKEL